MAFGVAECMSDVGKGGTPRDRHALRPRMMVATKEKEGQREQKKQHRGRHESGHTAGVRRKGDHGMQQGHASGRQCAEERKGPVEERGDEKQADDRTDISNCRADP